MDKASLEAHRAFHLSDEQILLLLEERCSRNRIVKMLDALNGMFRLAAEKMPAERAGLRAAAGLVDLYRLNYTGSFMPKTDDLRISTGRMSKTDVIREEIGKVKGEITYSAIKKNVEKRTGLVSTDDVRSIMFRMSESGVLRRVKEGVYVHMEARE